MLEKFKAAHPEMDFSKVDCYTLSLLRRSSDLGAFLLDAGNIESSCVFTFPFRLFLLQAKINYGGGGGGFNM